MWFILILNQATGNEFTDPQSFADYGDANRHRVYLEKNMRGFYQFRCVLL